MQFIDDLIQRFNQALATREARRVALRATQTHEAIVYLHGGSDVYLAEQEEITEDQSALLMRHSQFKTLLRIPNSVSVISYDNTESPLHYITAITRLHPPPSPERDVAPALKNPSIFEQVFPIMAKKCYSIRPKISGFKFADPTASLNGNNPSPFVGFCYYEQSFHRMIDKQDITSIPTPPNAKYFNYAGGIQRPLPQLAVVIRDGYGLRTMPQSTFAGIDTGERETYLKEPVRFILLGEVDDANDKVRIRRLIVDGQTLQMTRSNASFAIEYARILINQIFEGKNYDPAAAMQQVLASKGPSFTPTYRPTPT